MALYTVYRSTVSQGRPYDHSHSMFSTNDAVAPIMDEVDMNFRTIQFNGSFVHENVYRQDAGPDVDEAWEALGVECKYDHV